MSIIFLLFLVAIFLKIGNERRQCSGYLNNLIFMSSLVRINIFIPFHSLSSLDSNFFLLLFVYKGDGRGVEKMKGWERGAASGPSPPSPAVQTLPTSLNIDPLVLSEAHQNVTQQP